jgi:hypothetical protein
MRNLNRIFQERWWCVEETDKLEHGEQTEKIVRMK